MDERIKESISALMDDEANELELQRILSHVESEALNEQWQRYHLVREVIQSGGALNVDETESVLNIDISQSVSEWVENEDQPVAESQPKEDKTSSLPKVAGWMSLAASVAFAVVFVSQNNPLNPTGAYPAFAAIQAEGIERVSQRDGADVNQPKIIESIDADHARRLNQYLLRHAEHSMHGARQGAMPFVRVASVNSVGI